jgi:DNA processing protein
MAEGQLPFFETSESAPIDVADDLRDVSWLFALTRLDGIGNRRALQIVQHFKSAEVLRAASESEIASVVGKVKASFKNIKASNPVLDGDVFITTYFDSEYPPGLRDLSDPPLILWYRGSIPKQKSISIVGTRNIDDWGRSTTRKLAQMAGEAGFAVVSGLALGVDTEAHIGCLATTSPTVAILACDVRFPTPKSNANLANQILEAGGCLIAEVPLGATTEAHSLISRNRLQAAWSQSLLVTQCGIPSGTLHTVRFALELERTLVVLKPPHEARGEQYEGIRNLTDDYKFDSRILGGSKKFQESNQGKTRGADIVIGSISEFEKYLSNV